MRRLVFIAIILALLLLTSIVSADSNQKVSIDTSAIDTGVVSVSYKTDSDKIIKVMIEKDSKKYVYTLKNDGTLESFPLQMGNGSYTISVLENVSGNKYKFIQKETVNLDISDQNKVFLASIQNVNWNLKMESIKKAAEMTKKSKTEKDKIAVIYEHVVANYKYDYEKYENLPTEYIPVIDRTFEEGKGICYDYSSLFAAMLRSAGIPVKLVKGYTDNVEGYHAWNEILINKKWVVVDSTFDSQMKEAKKKYAMEKKASAYKTSNIY